MTIVCVIKSLKLLAADIAALHRKAFSSWKIDRNVSNKSLQLRLENEGAAITVHCGNFRTKNMYYVLETILENSSPTKWYCLNNLD